MVGIRGKNTKRDLLFSSLLFKVEYRFSSSAPQGSASNTGFCGTAGPGAVDLPLTKILKSPFMKIMSGVWRKKVSLGECPAHFLSQARV